VFDRRAELRRNVWAEFQRAGASPERALKEEVEAQLDLALGVMAYGPISPEELTRVREHRAHVEGLGLPPSKAAVAWRRSTKQIHLVVAEECSRFAPTGVLAWAQWELAERLLGHIHFVADLLVAGVAAAPELASDSAQSLHRALTEMSLSHRRSDRAGGAARSSMQCALVAVPGARFGSLDELQRRLRALVPDISILVTETSAMPYLTALLDEAGSAAGDSRKRITQLANDTGSVIIFWGASRDTLSAMHRRAIGVLALAHHVGQPTGAIELHELETISLITKGDQNDRDVYVHSILGALLAEPPKRTRRLLRTLDTCISGRGSAADAARDLHLDVKTVQAHLRDVGVLTGLDFGVPMDRFRLMLAYLYWTSDRDRYPDIGDSHWGETPQPVVTFAGQVRPLRSGGRHDSSHALFA